MAICSKSKYRFQNVMESIMFELFHSFINLCYCKKQKLIWPRKCLTISASRASRSLKKSNMHQKLSLRNHLEIIIKFQNIYGCTIYQRKIIFVPVCCFSETIDKNMEMHVYTVLLILLYWTIVCIPSNCLVNDKVQLQHLQ